MNINKIKELLSSEFKFNVKEIDKGLIFSNKNESYGFTFLNFNKKTQIPMVAFLNSIQDSPNFCCKTFFIVTSSTINLSHINAIESKHNFLFIDNIQDELHLIDEIIYYIE